MEFALAVTFGSSLQVALFVAPGPRPARGVMGQDMNLVFTPLEIAAVAAAVAYQLAHRHRRRDELARRGAADPRIRGPGHLVLRVRARRLTAAGDGAEGTRRRRGVFGSGGGRRGAPGRAARRRSTSSSSAAPGSKAASAIGSVADASPSATAWAAERIAACCGLVVLLLATRTASRRARRRSRSSSAGRPCRRPTIASGAGLRWRPAGPCRGSGRRSRPVDPRPRRGGTPTSPCRRRGTRWMATVNVVTFFPLARLRISGSRVRRPVSRTLFTVRSPSRSVGCADLDPASPAG